MKIIQHNKLTFNKEEEVAVQKIVRSGYWAGGKALEMLEKKVAGITKRKYAIGVSSGLSALRLSLLALGVGKNDEVIIPAYCCVAIPNAVLACGAKPIAVDVIHNNWNIDPKKVAQAIGPKTKAIIAINTFGLPAQFKELTKLKIPIIEDCAHALGSTSDGFIFGNSGIISITSFYATKLIGGGEGGAIFTDDEKIAKFVEDYRDYTDKEPSGFRLNEKMSNIDAALSLSQLKRLNTFISRRQNTADLYESELKKIKHSFPNFNIPVNTSRIWYRYTIHLKNVVADKLIKELKSNGISSAKPVEFWLKSTDLKKHPNSAFASQFLVSIPIYPTLTKKEKLTVIQAINKSIKALTNE
jgi:dTDP-4-amino-4,6-dideoxygalactose transaminase